MPYQEVMSEKPAAVCLSNGPGDPARVPQATEEIQKLVGKVPLLAICMGHQLLARALGGKTYKLKVNIYYKAKITF
jgi:carbamoyl-phosphate synthase small subunit